MPITEEARAQQGIPRPQAVAETAQLKERQVGGADTEKPMTSTDPAAQIGKAPARSQPRPAGAGALAAFTLGLLLGRRQRAEQKIERRENDHR